VSPIRRPGLGEGRARCRKDTTRVHVASGGLWSRGCVDRCDEPLSLRVLWRTAAGVHLRSQRRQSAVQFSLPEAGVNRGPTKETYRTLMPVNDGHGLPRRRSVGGPSIGGQTGADRLRKVSQSIIRGCPVSGGPPVGQATHARLVTHRLPVIPRNRCNYRKLIRLSRQGNMRA
jgi:hypothetical protein